LLRPGDRYMTTTLIYEKATGGLAWITLNRPVVLNAINMQMRDELWDLTHAVRDDPEVGVVIFKGAVLPGKDAAV